MLSPVKEEHVSQSSPFVTFPGMQLYNLVLQAAL